MRSAIPSGRTLHHPVQLGLDRRAVEAWHEEVSPLADLVLLRSVFGFPVIQKFDPRKVHLSLPDKRQLSLTGLVGLLVGSAILHLMEPDFYKTLVPSPLRRWSAEIVAMSAAAEFGCAVLLLLPPTRRLGAVATGWLFVAVFPANVQAVRDGGMADAPYPLDTAAVAWLRLPLEVLLVLWALSIRNDCSSLHDSRLDASSKEYRRFDQPAIPDRDVLRVSVALATRQFIFVEKQDAVIGGHHSAEASVGQTRRA